MPLNKYVYDPELDDDKLDPMDYRNIMRQEQIYDPELDQLDNTPAPIDYNAELMRASQELYDPKLTEEYEAARKAAQPGLLSNIGSAISLFAGADPAKIEAQRAARIKESMEPLDKKRELLKERILGTKNLADIQSDLAQEDFIKAQRPLQIDTMKEDLISKRENIKRQIFENKINEDPAKGMAIKQAVDLYKLATNKDLSADELIQLSTFNPKQLDSFNEQNKYLIDKATKDQELQLKQKEEALTPAEKAIDVEIGKKLAEWNVAGKPNFVMNKKKLEEGINLLEKTKSNKLLKTGILTGPFAKAVPELREASQNIKGAVNEMLRATLGPQFTEKEGERIMQQSFDDYASPEVNIEKAKAILRMLTDKHDSLESQSTYLKQNKGTLKGFDINKEATNVTFPKQVRKDGKIATVSNEQELNEALQEGWL